MTKKRFLAFAIVLALMLTLLPAATLAANPWVWIDHNSTYNTSSFDQGLFKVNDSVVLTADAFNFIPTSYQWYTNTTDNRGTATTIGGATGQSYTFTATAGVSYYWCVASSAAETATGGIGIFVEENPPKGAVTTQPRDQTVPIGSTATFTFDAEIIPSNATPISFQWYRSTDGGDNFYIINHANGKSYTTDPVTAANNGDLYICDILYEYTDPTLSSNDGPVVLDSTDLVLLTVIDPKTADVPETGDESAPLLWAGLIVLSLAGLAAGAVSRRKKENG